MRQLASLGRASEETSGLHYTKTEHEGPMTKKIDANGDRCRSGNALDDVVTEANRVKDPN